MDRAKLEEMLADADCVKVMSALFQAIAYCETIRSIIEPKQKEVLAKHQFKVAQKHLDKFAARGLEREPVVLDHSELYLVSDEDFEVYLDEMDSFHREKGFEKPAREYCPLLMAEELVRKTKREIADFLEPYTGISYDMVSYSLNRYRNYYDIILSLFAPKVKAIV